MVNRQPSIVLLVHVEMRVTTAGFGITCAGTMDEESAFLSPLWLPGLGTRRTTEAKSLHDVIALPGPVTFPSTAQPAHVLPRIAQRSSHVI